MSYARSPRPDFSITIGISWLVALIIIVLWRVPHPSACCLLHSLRLGAIGSGDRDGAAGVFADHFVADPVFDRLPGVEEAVAFAVLADAVGRLPGAFGQNAN